MTDIEDAYQRLIASFTTDESVTSGQMFGKPCLTIRGKAFIALHRDTIVFKLTGKAHANALALSEATRWDPSGKGKEMKEWIALKHQHRAEFASLSKSAADYVSTLA